MSTDWQQLPSGLFVPPESQPDPQPEPEPPAVTCTVCKRPVPDPSFPFYQQGWFRRAWTCRCVVSWNCAECYKSSPDPACPVCGCDCEYC